MTYCVLVIALLIGGLIFLVMGKNSNLRLSQVEDEFGVLMAAEYLGPSIEEKAHNSFWPFSEIESTPHRMGEAIDINLFYWLLKKPNEFDGYKLLPERDVKGIGKVRHVDCDYPRYEITHLSIGRARTTLADSDAEEYLKSLLLQILAEYQGEMIVKGNLLIDLDSKTRELFLRVLSSCGFQSSPIGFSCICVGSTRSTHAH
jgi:hypothetical protein